eukprot:13836894-Alexandrium_andersonii.AAC.1
MQEASDAVRAMKMDQSGREKADELVASFDDFTKPTGNFGAGGVLDYAEDFKTAAKRVKDKLAHLLANTSTKFQNTAAASTLNLINGKALSEMDALSVAVAATWEGLLEKTLKAFCDMCSPPSEFETSSSADAKMRALGEALAELG